jgi:hypothetical protein
MWIAYSAPPAAPSGCGGGEPMRRAFALRRIWKIQASGTSRPMVLTRDERYRDEEPQWASDGRNILFCLIDETRAQTVWLMRSDGNTPMQVAGPLDANNANDPDLAWFGYYGEEPYRLVPRQNLIAASNFSTLSTHLGACWRRAKPDDSHQFLESTKEQKDRRKRDENPAQCLHFDNRNDSVLFCRSERGAWKNASTCHRGPWTC